MESLSISVQENTVINFFNIMQPWEHFLQRRLWHWRQYFLRAHNFVSSPNIHVKHFSIEIVLLSYQPFLMLPSVFLSLNLIKFGFQLLLSCLILVRNHIMILLKRIVINFKLLQFLVKSSSYFHHVVSERFFDFRDRLIELLLYL